MRGILLALIMMISPMSASTSSEFFLLTDNAYVYAEASYASEQLAEIKYGDKLTLESQEKTNGFYYISFVKDETAIFGYVNADLVGEKAEAQDVILSYNAKIATDTIVYNISNDSELCTIKKGTQVLLFEGYSNKKDYLPVKFVADGKVIIGKVKTEDVAPYGVNSALIISVTAIMALVSVAMILFGITKKKRHKNLKT